MAIWALHMSMILVSVTRQNVLYPLNHPQKNSLVFVLMDNALSDDSIRQDKVIRCKTTLGH